MSIITKKYTIARIDYSWRMQYITSALGQFFESDVILFLLPSAYCGKYHYTYRSWKGFVTMYCCYV